MVNQAPNRKRPSQKQVFAQARQKQAQQHSASQLAINATLWRIIMQNAESQEGYDPEKSATLTVPREDLEGVPETFSLKVESLDDGNIIITASNPEPKSNLILPDKEIVV